MRLSEVFISACEKYAYMENSGVSDFIVNPSKSDLNRIAEKSNLYNPQTNKYSKEYLVCRCIIDLDNKKIYAWSGLPLHQEARGRIDSENMVSGFFIFDGPNFFFSEFTEEYGPSGKHQKARELLKNRYKTIKFKKFSGDAEI